MDLSETVSQLHLTPAPFEALQTPSRPLKVQRGRSTLRAKMNLQRIVIYYISSYPPSLPHFSPPLPSSLFPSSPHPQITTTKIPTLTPLHTPHSTRTPLSTTHPLPPRESPPKRTIHKNPIATATATAASSTAKKTFLPSLAHVLPTTQPVFDFDEGVV